MMAVEARPHVAVQQAAGNVPWVRAHSDEDVRRLQGKHRSPEKLTGADDPRHTLQENGGLADFWCLDDGDILCHPAPVGSPRSRSL